MADKDAEQPTSETASSREYPLITLANCTLIARRPSAFQAGHIPSWRGSCERYALSSVAAVSRWLLLLLSPLLSAALRGTVAAARLGTGPVSRWPPAGHGAAAGRFAGVRGGAAGYAAGPGDRGQARRSAPVDLHPAGRVPGDRLDDLFPGSGAVGRAWAAYTGGDPSLAPAADTSGPDPGDASSPAGGDG